MEGKEGGVVPKKNIYCLYVNNFFENTKGSIHQLKLLLLGKACAAGKKIEKY